MRFREEMNLKEISVKIKGHLARFQQPYTGFDPI